VTDAIGATHGPAEQDAQPGHAGSAGTAARTGVRAALLATRARRTEEIDRQLARLLGAEADVALVAVGSHGRRELTPGGDLDLVLLHRDRPGIGALADRVWYPIWDSGQRLDHSVRTPEEARAVARDDLKAALGMIYARHVAGDPELTKGLRDAVLADWRSDARRRLPELREMTRRRWEDYGELAFLLEPDLKESRGGLRDVHAMYAVAAAWVSPGPSPRVREAYELVLDVRHALHETTGRGGDRLVLQEQEAVAAALGLLDAEVLLRSVVEAARTITFGVDHVWRRVARFCSPPGRPVRRPLADGVVEHDAEVVLALGVDVAKDPSLVLRVAAAAAQEGLPLAIATVERLARESRPLPVPWPPEARDALVALLGAGAPAIGVWEALDQMGLIERLLPDWERVRNRPQRNPVHTYTVDRHLVETATRAAAHTRDVSRPDLLLVGALLHDIGKGWPGDHSRTGAVMARDIGERLGFDPADVRVLEAVVRHHLLLPETATRRDLDDPVTIETVAAAVGDIVVLETLAALAIADGQATGPAAWGAWKARAGPPGGRGTRRRAPAGGSGADVRAARPRPARRRRRPGHRIADHRGRARPARPVVAGGGRARAAPAGRPRRPRRLLGRDRAGGRRAGGRTAWRSERRGPSADGAAGVHRGSGVRLRTRPGRSGGRSAPRPRRAAGRRAPARTPGPRTPPA
jgi:[protein-PII] uridylyltransferase